MRLLAFGELRRGGGRFGLLAGAIAVLSFLVVLQQAFLSGLVGQLNGGLRASDADLFVLDQAAAGALPASTVSGEAVGVARAVSGVTDAGPVRFGAATAVVGGAEVDVVLVGVDPGRPGWPAALLGGRAAGTDAEVVASAGDGFTPGASVRVLPGGQPLEVVGLAADANLSVAPTLYVPTVTFLAVTRAQRPASLSAAPRTAVAVRIADGADTAAVAAALGAALADVDVLTRDEAARRFPGVAEVTHSFAIVLGLLGIVVALVAGLFWVALTVQKIPALTLLRAVGVRSGTLVGALLVQVVVVVSAGLAVGTAVAGLVLRGVDFGFDARLDAWGAAASAASIMALVLVAALAAVRRVRHVDPAAALAGRAR